MPVSVTTEAGIATPGSAASSRSRCARPARDQRSARRPSRDRRAHALHPGGRGQRPPDHLTEGVLVEETREPRARSARERWSRPTPTRCGSSRRARRPGDLTVAPPGRRPGRGRSRAEPARFAWGRVAAAAGEHLTGLGARHGEPFDQAGRLVRLGADRRYTGPDCPPEMLDEGGIPQGDYVPGAVAHSRAPAGRSGSRPAAPGLELDLRDRDRDLPARRRRAACACGCSATRPRPAACATTCG